VSARDAAVKLLDLAPSGKSDVRAVNVLVAMAQVYALLAIAESIEKAGAR
jgi:hypothetical protein